MKTSYEDRRYELLSRRVLERKYIFLFYWSFKTPIMRLIQSNLVNPTLYFTAHLNPIIKTLNGYYTFKCKILSTFAILNSEPDTTRYYPIPILKDKYTFIHNEYFIL